MNKPSASSAPARFDKEIGDRRIARSLVGIGALMAFVGAGVASYHIASTEGEGAVGKTVNLVRNLARAWKDRENGAYRAALEPPVRAAEPLIAFDNGVQPGWQDWSWAKRAMDARLTGEPKTLILFHPAGYQGIYLHTDARDSVGYGAVEIELCPAKPGGNLASTPLYAVLVGPDNRFGPKISLAKHMAAGRTGRWQVARVPLKVLQDGIGRQFSGVVLMAGAQATLPSVYVRRILLLPDATLPAPPSETSVAVTVDIAAERHPISPYIYGVAFGTPDEVKGLRPGLRRWGGNPNTRYNWLTNAWNSARDWHFLSHGDDPTKPGQAADSFIRESAASGATVLFTIPTIGWVTRTGVDKAGSKNVPNEGGIPLKGPDGPIAGYDPTENRRRTSVRSVARKGKPFDYPPVPQPENPGPDFAVAQDEFVHFLTKRFGTAAGSGVRFYAMDNEPDLWAHTHTDIKPALLGYDDLFGNFREYAAAVKAVDPTAMVTGPVSWGWTNYLYSPLDRGTDNYRTHADRKAHGDLPFLVWFLRQAKNVERETGQRLLDVLDVHYYPQSDVYNEKADPETAARRIRSVRSLFDARYADESWIGEPVRLLPRLKEWVAQEYPGTKIGLTEWSFGGEKHISGALASAEALCLFGREDLYLASYWTTPKKDSPAYLAFRLLLNPEGEGKRGVESVSCRAVSSNDSRLSAYATTDETRRLLALVLINKMPKTAITVPIDLRAGSVSVKDPATVYRLTADGTGTKAQIDRSVKTIGSDRFTLTVPPYSIVLLRVPLATGEERN
ncbi:MAG: glycoside hydrolase family 44 protein [Capsulimonadales bacterium]|nr:glycoside hydrolase family 44 protein [Capsulimonadales bacterium]